MWFTLIRLGKPWKWLSVQQSVSLLNHSHQLFKHYQEFYWHLVKESIKKITSSTQNSMYVFPSTTEFTGECIKIHLKLQKIKQEAGFMD